MLSAVYHDALAELELKVSWFNVLNAIANREETRPAKLAKLLEMDESTLSRNVARMCTGGWLRLEPGEGDQRSHQISLTEKGIALLRKSYPGWQKAQDQVADRLGSDGVAGPKPVKRRLRC